MSIDVTATLEIAAPPAAVAAVQFDPARDPEWIGGVDRVELVTPPPFGLGSQVRRIGGFLGHRIVWLMRTDAFEPDHHVGLHALESPFPMTVDYRLEPGPDGRSTRASIRVRGEPRGLYAALGPLTGPLVRSSVAGDLRRLRRMVEARAAPPR